MIIELGKVSEETKGLPLTIQDDGGPVGSDKTRSQ